MVWQIVFDAAFAPSSFGTFVWLRVIFCLLGWGVIFLSTKHYPQFLMFLASCIFSASNLILFVMSFGMKGPASVMQSSFYSTMLVMFLQLTRSNLSVKYVVALNILSFSVLAWDLFVNTLNMTPLQYTMVVSWWVVQLTILCKVGRTRIMKSREKYFLRLHNEKLKKKEVYTRNMYRGGGGVVTKVDHLVEKLSALSSSGQLSDEALQIVMETQNALREKNLYGVTAQELRNVLDQHKRITDEDVKGWVQSQLTSSNSVLRLPKLGPKRGAARRSLRASPSSKTTGSITLPPLVGHKQDTPPVMPAGPSGRSVLGVNLGDPLVTDILMKGKHMSFDLDMLDVAERSDGRALQVVLLGALRKLELFDRLNGPRLFRLAVELEAGYHSNPYHNSTHAADVVNGVQHFLTAFRGQCETSSLDSLALVLGAAMHDIDHGGLNNSFHIRTRSEMALRYSDSAVLERHHLSVGFRILLNPLNDVIAHFREDEFKTFRATVIHLVLATDLSKHVECISEYTNIDINAAKKQPLIFLRAAIQMSDLGHGLKPTEVHIKWTQLVAQEFFEQGDKELGMDLKPSFLCGRETNLPQSQLAFFEFLVEPLLTAVSRLIPGNEPLFQSMKQNKDYWKHFTENGRSITVASSEVAQSPPGSSESKDKFGVGEMPNDTKAAWSTTPMDGSSSDMSKRKEQSVVTEDPAVTSDPDAFVLPGGATYTIVLYPNV